VRSAVRLRLKVRNQVNFRIKCGVNEREFRQVEKELETEIKMYKQRPRISDKSKFLNKKSDLHLQTNHGMVEVLCSRSKSCR